MSEGYTPHNEKMDPVKQDELQKARGDFNTFDEKISDMDSKIAAAAAAAGAEGDNAAAIATNEENITTNADAIAAIEAAEIAKKVVAVVEPVEDTYTLDFASASNFKITCASADAKTVAFTGFPAAASDPIEILKFKLYLDVTTAATFTWPAEVIWAEAFPVLTENKSYVAEFETLDNGTVAWFATLAGPF